MFVQAMNKKCLQSIRITFVKRGLFMLTSDIWKVEQEWYGMLKFSLDFLCEFFDAGA